MTSDEVRAAVVRETLGRLDEPAVEDYLNTGNRSLESILNTVLPSLGGTWELVHAHVWQASDLRTLGRGARVMNCQDPCPFASGRHEVRRRWTSDPVTP